MGMSKGLKKAGLIAGGLLGAGALAYGASKLLRGKKKFKGIRRGSNAKLRGQIERLKLKRLKIREQKNLFKEQLKI